MASRACFHRALAYLVLAFGFWFSFLFFCFCFLFLFFDFFVLGVLFFVLLVLG